MLKGNRSGIAALTRKALEDGMEADAILNDCLMPGINRVGELFDSGRYFLPQLISGAEAMKLSIGVLEPYLLQDENREKLPAALHDGRTVIRVRGHDRIALQTGI